MSHLYNSIVLVKRYDSVSCQVINLSSTALISIILSYTAFSLLHSFTILSQTTYPTLSSLSFGSSLFFNFFLSFHNFRSALPFIISNTSIYILLYTFFLSSSTSSNQFLILLHSSILCSTQFNPPQSVRLQMLFHPTNVYSSPPHYRILI